MTTDRPRALPERQVTTMDRSSGPLRRAVLWSALATACVLGAIPAAGTTLPLSERAAAPAANHARVPVVHIDPDPDPVRVGGLVTIRVLLANQGPDTTPVAVTVTVTLPRNVHPTGPYFPQTCRAQNSTVTCTFPPGLHVGRTAAVLVQARVAANAPVRSTLPDGVVNVANPGDPEAFNRSVNYDLRTDN